MAFGLQYISIAFLVFLTRADIPASSSSTSNNNNNNNHNNNNNNNNSHGSKNDHVARCHVMQTCRESTLAGGGLRIKCDINSNNNEIKNDDNNNNNSSRIVRLDDIVSCSRTEDGWGTVNPTEVRELHISGSLPLKTLDVSVLRPFANLMVLNVSGNGIENVTWGNDGCDLENLRQLDLSRNSLEDISHDVFTCNPHLTLLNIIDNNWQCKLLEWFIDWVRVAEKKGLGILDKREIHCTYVPSTGGTERYEIWDMIDSCPGNCSCVLKFGRTMVVDCSGRNFTNFPDTIPNNTRNFNIQNNAIRNFQKLIHTDAYRKLSQLSVEDNAIQSLDELEGIYRTIPLTTLNLAGNRITHLPVHILEQMKLTTLKLGRNPWECDCVSGTALRDYLTDQFRNIGDLDNITCSATDKNHPGKLVRRLSPVDLCYIPDSDVHILDIINGFLALLIFIVLSKHIYDWLYFRRTGKLPLSPWAYFIQKHQVWKERQYENCFDVEERHSPNDGIKA